MQAAEWEDQPMDDALRAIADPTRRAILRLVRDDEVPAGEIATHFPTMSRPAVSQHLRVLLDAGLVTEQRHGRERRYRLVPAQLGPVRDWMAYYERFWDEHLERLEKHQTKRDE